MTLRTTTPTSRRTTHPREPAWLAPLRELLLHRQSTTLRVRARLLQHRLRPAMVGRRMTRPDDITALTRKQLEFDRLRTSRAKD